MYYKSLLNVRCTTFQKIYRFIVSDFPRELILRRKRNGEQAHLTNCALSCEYTQYIAYLLRAHSKACVAMRWQCYCSGKPGLLSKQQGYY